MTVITTDSFAAVDLPIHRTDRLWRGELSLVVRVIIRICDRLEDGRAKWASPTIVQNSIENAQTFLAGFRLSGKSNMRIGLG